MTRTMMRTMLRTITLLLSLAALLTASTAQGEWVTYPPSQTSHDYGPVVTDVERHLYPGHPYRENSDKVGWTHEGTHGVNSLVRNKYGRPGFYTLNNTAYLLAEPNTTIAAVARKVPPSLRSNIYNSYCIQMQGNWNYQPSYLFDEWTSYMNGSIARKKLKIANRSETIGFTLEMAIYSTCVPYTAKSTGAKDDENTKIFLRWMWERTLFLIDKNNKDALKPLRENTDAESLRVFMRDYFGKTWTKKQLGF